MQDEPSTKRAAVRDDVQAPGDLGADDAALDDLRAIKARAEEGKSAGNRFVDTLRETRVAYTKHAEANLKALARVVAQAQSAADDLPAVEDLGKARDLAKTMSEAAAPLLRSPLTEDTRQNQTRLLIASALALLVGSGLMSIEKVTVGMAEGKFESGKVPWVVVAIVFACLYCLIAFIGAYRRDILTSHVSWADAASQLRVVGKQLTAEFARLLELQRKELEELKSCSANTEVHRAAQEQFRVSSLQLDLLGQLVGMYHGIMHRTRSLMRLRLWMEFLLPFTVVLIALGLCGHYLLVVATW